MHPFCAPIEIAKDDKFYSKHGMKCMSYVRSVPAVRPSCTLGPLEQVSADYMFIATYMPACVRLFTYTRLIFLLYQHIIF